MGNFDCGRQVSVRSGSVVGPGSVWSDGRSAFGVRSSTGGPEENRSPETFGHEARKARIGVFYFLHFLEFNKRRCFFF